MQFPESCQGNITRVERLRVQEIFSFSAQGIEPSRYGRGPTAMMFRNLIVALAMLSAGASPAQQARPFNPADCGPTLRQRGM
jgi:hypothetical protein